MRVGDIDRSVELLVRRGEIVVMVVICGLAVGTELIKISDNKHYKSVLPDPDVHIISMKSVITWKETAEIPVFHRIRAKNASKLVNRILLHGFRKTLQRQHKNNLLNFEVGHNWKYSVDQHCLIKRLII